MLISFIGALLSLLLLGGLAYRSSVRQADTLARAARLQEVLVALADYRAVLTATEANNRAYEITGDRSYLSPTVNLRAWFSELRGKLDRTSERNQNVMPPSLMRELERRTAHRIELFDRLLALAPRQTGNNSALNAAIATGSAETAALEGLIEDAEHRVLSTIRHDAGRTEAQRRDTAALFAAMIVSTVLFLALMFREIWLKVRERGHIQQRLAEREQNLQAVIDAAVDGIVATDSEGVVRDVNPAAVRLFGYAAEEVIGRDVSMLLPESRRGDRNGRPDDYRRTDDGSTGRDGREISGRRKDGSVFPLEIAVGETRRAGARSFIAIVRDITVRKQAEAGQQKALADVRAANEELRSFSYVVSHDLKAPLRAIGSLASWLMEDYGGKLGDEGNRQLDLLVGRVQRMDRLIDGILAYSRAGRALDDPEPVDAGKALAAALALIEVPAQMHVEVQSPLPQVLAHPVQLQQVFQNLIANAVKHANVPHGRIRIGCDDDGADWRFHVCDSGPGIEAGNFERIFRLFQTLVPKDSVENTGVGLAIVKKIVESCGGRVWVESERGQGACFFFTLPKDPARAVAPGVEMNEEAMNHAE